MHWCSILPALISGTTLDTGYRKVLLYASKRRTTCLWLMLYLTWAYMNVRVDRFLLRSICSYSFVYEVLTSADNHVINIILYV